MVISDLIKKLEYIREKQGDLTVCKSEYHEYWNTIDSHLDTDDFYVGNAQPEGPKSGKSEICLIFSC